MMLALALATTPPTFQQREADWRNGAIVYQVFVDRFAPSSTKKAPLQAARRLMRWGQTPKPGHLIKSAGLWSHELEFWGGDLRSLTSKLAYIHHLGADVLYTTPIFKAYTNHGYDTEDYAMISPELGTKMDLANLTKEVHIDHMRLILDGVFNHMGRSSDAFQTALHNPVSPYRKWFDFDPKYKGGYRGWSGVANLPALRLEDSSVRDYLWSGSNSIVRRYLKEGVDGWRLDVAFEIGPKFLREITDAAHAAKPGSAVVGEISGYPANWFPAVDGVFDFFQLDVVKQALNGSVNGARAGRMLQHVVDDAGIDNLLKSWLLLDNHDTPRLANELPNLAQRKLALAMQFTLPGCPVIYYGSELGMTGAGDPQNRAPMRWDLATGSNPTLDWVRKLIAVRKSLPALRYGDFTALDTDKLIAFVRRSNRLAENVIVVANLTSHSVHEVFPTRVGRLMSWGELEDKMTGQGVKSINGDLSLDLGPYQTMILVPVEKGVGGISPYRRVP